jgi:hypothetical protein
MSEHKQRVQALTEAALFFRYQPDCEAIEWKGGELTVFKNGERCGLVEFKLGSETRTYLSQLAAWLGDSGLSEVVLRKAKR